MTPTIEEVKRVALDKGAFVSIECVTYSLKDGEIVLTKAQLQAFAQHYIEVGRKEQREIDAHYLETRCDSPYLAYAIRNNTGE